MANTSALVTKLEGQAWIRNADGNLEPLRVGMRIPVDAEIITAAGTQLALQGNEEGVLQVAEDQQLKLADELFVTPDPAAAAIAAPANADVNALITALNQGQDPLAELDPTAATLAGGEGGGSTFVRLSSVIENTSPLALQYPSPTTPTTDNFISGGVIAVEQPATPGQAGVASDVQSVNEAGLTSVEDTREVTTGSVTVTATDGVAAINIGGTSFTLAQLQGDVTQLGSINTGEGTLKITGYVAGPNNQSGTLSYEYTLNAAQTHANGQDNNTLTDTIAVTVGGAGGSTGSGAITITIVDDVPTIKVDTAATGAYGAAVTGSVDMAFGADGEKSVTVSVNGAAAVTGVKGEDGNYTFTLGDGKVVTLNAATGDFSYNGAPASGAGTAYKFSFTVQDKDGDTASAETTATLTKTDTGSLAGTASASDKDVAANTDGDADNNISRDVAVVGLPAGAKLSAGTYGGGSDNYGTVTVDADGKATYQQTKLFSHDPASADTKVDADAVTVKVTLADGSQVDMVVKVSIADDVPTAVVTQHATLGNGAGAAEIFDLDNRVDGAINSYGADGAGTVRFDTALNGTIGKADDGTMLKSAGQPIFYTVSDDGLTLVGHAGGTTGATVFTVTLNPTSGTYTVDMDAVVDSPSNINFLGAGYTATGGNSSWYGYVKTAETNSADLLITPTSGTTINSNGNTFGVGAGNSIGAGEGIRLDFVRDLLGTPVNGGDYSAPNGSSHTFNQHYAVNGAVFVFSNINKETTVKFIAFDDADGNASIGDGVKDPITTVAISYGGQTVVVSAANPAVSVGGHSFGVTFLNGEAQVSGIVTGASISSYTASGYNSIEARYVSGDTFKVGVFNPSSLDTEPVDFKLPIQIVDGDNDTAASSIDITLTSSQPVVGAAFSSVMENSSTTVTGAMSVSTMQTVTSLMVAGKEVVGATSQNPVVVQTDKGTLTVTGYDAATGTVSYSYKEKGQSYDHSAGKDSIHDDFLVTVKTSDGVAHNGSLTVRIEDSVPVTASDVDHVTEGMTKGVVALEGVLTNDTSENGWHQGQGGVFKVGVGLD